MENKFKVGDRVKCSKDSGYSFCPCDGTVEDVVSNRLYRVKVDGEKCTCYEDGCWNFWPDELTPATSSDENITMKVRCIGYKQDKEKRFTLGKVYEWKNGTLMNDNGYKYDSLVNGTNPADWKLSEWYDFEVVTDEGDMKVIITSDGKITLARLCKDGKVIQMAKAICSPDDEFDFRFGAKLAMERLMGTPDEKPEEKKNDANNRAFKEGDRVRLKGSDAIGTVICGAFDGDVGVEYDVQAYRNGHNCEAIRLAFGHTGTKGTSHWESPKDLELVKDEPKHKTKPTYYSGKVVCVKAGEHRAYTVGKVYEFKDGFVTIDNGNKLPCDPVKTLEEFNRIGFYIIGARFIPFVE